MHIHRLPSESIVFQTYLHYEVDLDSTQKESAFELLKYAADSTYPESLATSDIRFDIQIDEGSIKGWVTTLGSIYLAIAGYGSFRSGIDYIVSDCRDSAHWVINAFENRFPGKKIRTERRTEAPGTILRIYDDLDKLSSAAYVGDNLKIEQRIWHNFKSLERLLSPADQVEILPLVSEAIKSAPVLPFNQLSEQLLIRKEETDIPLLDDEDNKKKKKS